MIAEYRVITQSDIDAARESWERANEAAQSAWALVERATQDAQEAEAHALELHERYARISVQRGFRRAS